jgi:hypothetical protein
MPDSEHSAGVIEHKARLKCPVCDREYGVAGFAAVGVSDGEKRPCSWECQKRYSQSVDTDTDRRGDPR